MREGDGMNTKTNTKPTAAEIAAAVERERRRAPLDKRDWSDKTADRFVELTADIYAADNDDTEVEARRGFSIVWNANGAWRVEVKRGRVTRLA
jgi:hypothetical protein